MEYAIDSMDTCHVIIEKCSNMLEKLFCRWSEWLEGRWLILKSGIRVHGVDIADEI